MKNSSFKRILSLALAMIMALAVISCTPSTPPSENPAGESTPSPEGSTPSETDVPSAPNESVPEIPDVNEDLKIAEGGASQFKLVRGELAAAYEKTITSSLASFFKNDCGVTLQVSDDWVNEALGYTESEYEILVGKTNREESILVYNNLRSDDYAVTVVGKKIVIAAYTEAKLSEAVTYFTEKLQKTDGGATLLAKDAIVKKGIYGVSSINVNGVELSNYKIIYQTATRAEIKEAATLLATELQASYSYVLSVATDASEETPYEIVIGGTNRGNSQELNDRINSYDYSITVSGNRIFIIPGANQKVPGEAVKAFLEAIGDILSGGKAQLTSSSLNVVHTETYLTKDIILNGTPISEYIIVYKNNDPVTGKLAQRLRDEIDKTCGRRLTVTSDSQSYRDSKEILVGTSTRTDASGPASALNAKVSAIGSGEYLMYKEGDFFFVGGSDYVGTMGAINKLIAAITDVKNAESHSVEFNVSSPKAVNQTSYKVITYNDGDNSTTKINQVSTIITDYDPDIVGMQEVQQVHANTYKLKLKGYDVVYYDHDSYLYGAPILYKTDRFELLEKGTQWLSSTPDKKFTKFAESDYIRSYVYAILKDKATGEELVVVNTHVDYIDAANRKQIAVLLECTERFRGRPIIYTGDFNMRSTSNGYQQMYKSGLRDCGSYLGYNIGDYIDFCFVDMAYVVATDFKYINDHEYSSTASDHCPVYSEIVLAS